MLGAGAGAQTGIVTLLGRLALRLKRSEKIKAAIARIAQKKAKNVDFIAKNRGKIGFSP
jgi:hypothetical protein